ncbi:MAG TPA: HipA domain-containing protein [Acidimicrobiales bacterium]
MSDLELMRTIQVADVYKAGRKAAQLRRTASGTEFAYLPEYLNDGIPVATTLPLSNEPRFTTPGSVPPFFAGLLPEGRRLLGLRRSVKTSADDEFSLLLAVGQDPVGDVQVVPVRDQPREQEPLITVQKSFEEVRFREVLADAGVIDRVSIPGVQEKASAGMISVPIALSGNRYILKIDPPEYPHVVENEFYFVSFAKSIGIPTVDVQIVQDVDGIKGLLLQRFDRVSEHDGETTALACEDACQLLGRWPGDKYNVSYEDVAHAVASVCAAGVIASRDVFRQICFAWLTGNGDVHAKNISVVKSLLGEWSVAPAYDLPSTVLYDDDSMALTLDGRTSELSRRAVFAFASTIGLSEIAATKILDGLLSDTEPILDDLKKGVLPFDENTVSRALRVLRHRRTLLQSR